MNFKLHRHLLKIIATVALSACYPMAFAGSTDISNSPLPVNSSVLPNIIFTLDTSGSMSNIVPGSPTDTVPYDASITYLASCPSVFAGGVAAPLYSATDYEFNVDSSGVVTVGPNGGTLVTFGTGTGQKCFDPTLRYSAFLNNSPDSVTDYTGNYLNWYFCTGSAPNCDTAANFGASATRKPGTLTRIEATQSAAKIIVDSLANVRTGLVRYKPNFGSGTTTAGGQLSVAVAENDATQKNAIKTAINGFTAGGYTPLTGTLSGIGAYLAKTTTADPTSTLTLHPATPPITSYTDTTLNTNTATAATIFSGNGAMLINGTSAAAPIQYYCQKSFAVLMTDGRPNYGYTVSTKIQDYLGIMSGINPAKGRKSTTGTANHVNANGKTQLHLGDPHSYESGGDDYLDDIAGALYDIDLRPDLLPALVAGVQPPKTTKNNLYTYTIALADLQAINDPLLQETAAAGGGLFLPAADTAGLVSAFDAAVNDILSKDSSAAAVAVANAHITSTDNAAYYTSYNAGTWSGDLIAYKLDVLTGSADVTTPIWNSGCADPTALVDPLFAATGVRGCSAQVMLDERTTARQIFTTDDSAGCLTNCGIPFQVATGNLTSTQLVRLRTNTASTGTTAIAEATDVVNYLRGDKSKENTTMRKRIHLLGDTVNAEPLVVRRPERNYGDLNYVAYRESNASRSSIILQAANDGMLHAFNELTGVEEWAYIPGMLINDSNDPVDSTISLLNTRTRKNGFIHYYLLDATPVTGDVDLANSGTTGVTTTQWATIVVGGMGKGGRGYYALDLTTPTATTETLVAAKALWEFPRSVVNNAQRAAAKLNMGYSFAKPVIIKTQAKGWVVLVSSGYNNGTNTGESGGDGLGHLYVLNASTGDLIADLTTNPTNCGGANPCGFSAVNAYVEAKDSDNTAELVYGGDLYGNLWRFDLRGTTVAGWRVSKMATLRSGTTSTAAVQPITTIPELARITDATSDSYMVYVGTGLYLGKTDLPCPLTGSCPWTPDAQSTQTQTMYGLKDSRTNVATVETLTSLPDPLKVATVLQQQTYGTGSPRVFTHATVDFTSLKGWYVDFTNGERLVTNPAIAVGQVIFTSNIPSSEPCIPGGSSWIYFLDYATGGALKLSDGTWDQSTGTFLGNKLSSGGVVVQTSDGKISVEITGSDDSKDKVTGHDTGVATTATRVSWRELIDK